MIKIVFQTAYYKLPKYIIEMVKNKCIGWEYIYFSDLDIIEFIQNNPIEEFSDAITVFKSIQNCALKSDFFRYYFLYLKGGLYLDSDATLEKNIEDIIQDYKFCTVESGLDKNKNGDMVFNGFIYSEPKNAIIYNALKNIYNADQKEICDNYFLICQNFFKLVKEQINILNSYNIKNVIKIFKEKVENLDYSSIFDDNNETIVKHYYNKNCVIENGIFNKNIDLKNKKSIKIGITFNLPNNIHQLYSNGINQNTLYFNEVLLNIGYDSYLLIDDNKLNEIRENDLKEILYDTRFKYIKQTEILNSELDILFMFGYHISDKAIINTLKYMKTKIIGYCCGNSYIIDSEKILYNQHKKNNGDYGFAEKDNELFDQIWSIPQMVNTNMYYWKTMHRCDCIEVPFIWSDQSIKFSEKIRDDHNMSLMYINRGELKKLVIFEPNISIMKWALPAILVCENAYRINKKIERVFINNIYPEMNNSKINEFNLEMFNKIVKNLDLKTNGCLCIEKRYNTLNFMAKYADIVVSHQWENPLNYLYLDLAWMGWPIIHNAHLCKDVGYYYDGFNYENGGKVLNDVIINHDKNINKYIENNRKNINRFLPTNNNLKSQYDLLITKLLLS
jgi:hypothetical protein